MVLVSLHVTSRRSGLDTLERFTAGRAETLARSITSRFPGSECVVVRTCNRFEIYLAVAEADGPKARAALSRRPLARGQDVLSGFDTVLHLFSVAAGLDSELLGEDEVLGQVRTSYVEAKERGEARTELGPLFERAIFTGRRVRKETGISRGCRSLSGLAIGEARKVYPDLKDRAIGILGTGEMGRKILARLLDEGAEHVEIASKTDVRRAQLSSEWPVPVLSPEALLARLDHLDVLFCAAETERPYEVMLEQRRRGSPLVVVDLGMPRNLRVAAGRGRIRRVDLRALQRLSRQESRQKDAMVPRAMTIVEEEAQQYLRVQQESDVARFAEGILSRAYAVAQEEGERAFAKLSGDHDPRETLDRYGQSIVKRLLLPSVNRLKGLSPEERRTVLRSIALLFPAGQTPGADDGKTVGKALADGSRRPRAAPRRSGSTRAVEMSA